MDVFSFDPIKSYFNDDACANDRNLPFFVSHMKYMIRHDYCNLNLKNIKVL